MCVSWELWKIKFLVGDMKTVHEERKDAKEGRDAKEGYEGRKAGRD